MASRPGSTSLRASSGVQASPEIPSPADFFQQELEDFKASDIEEESTDSRPRKRLRRGKCRGCGHDLQTAMPDAVGYVKPEDFELKARHRQQNSLMCWRCRELSHGAFVPGVQDWWQAQGLTSPHSPEKASPEGPLKLLATPEQLRLRLAHIQKEAAVVVLLVDLLDAGSFLARARDMVGRNPIILIGTKVDLLPKGTDEAAVAEWLHQRAAAKKLTIASLHLVSSRTQKGIPEAVKDIRMCRRGRSVYVVGAANVGKSAFIRALVGEMGSRTSAQYDPAADAVSRRLPVESGMPGTTLQLIPLQAFSSGSALYDTPGVHLAHRIPHMLSPADNQALQPRGRLRAYVQPHPRDMLGGSYCWGALARLDVMEAPDDLEIVFFSLPCLRPHTAPTGRATVGTGAEQGDAAALPGEAAVAARGGLQAVREIEVAGRSKRPARVDVAVSGVAGWIRATTSGRAVLRLRVPRGIETFVMAPLPVGPAAQGQPVRREESRDFWDG